MIADSRIYVNNVLKIMKISYSYTYNLLSLVVATAPLSTCYRYSYTHKAYLRRIFLSVD